MSASKVGNDFKSAFALLLTINKVNYGIDPALNYAETIIEWTLGGLITDGKIKQVWKDGVWTLEDVDSDKHFAQAFNYAMEKYTEAVGHVGVQATSGRKEWIQKEILSRCIIVNTTIFPIALSEGLLDLKDVAAGIGAGASGIPMERDR